MYNILICDDDRDIVSALDIYLTSEGYATVKAYDGLEALELVKEHDIHLILMPPLEKTALLSSATLLRPPRVVYRRSWLLTRAMTSTGLKGLVM